MCGYQDALSNIMPVDWFDPYGRTPFAKDAELSVDITIVETEDGIKASSVKNPPTSGSNRLMNAIKQALGVDFGICGAENGSQRSADLGKQERQESDVSDTGNDSNDKKQDKSVVSEQDDEEKEKAPFKS